MCSQYWPVRAVASVTSWTSSWNGASAAPLSQPVSRVSKPLRWICCAVARPRTLAAAGVGVAGAGVGEAVDGAAVLDKLPVDGSLAHLFFECRDDSRRNKRVIGAVQGENLALDVPGVFGRRRRQVAMEADDAGQV